jgi:hypothetical protein
MLPMKNALQILLLGHKKYVAAVMTGASLSVVLVEKMHASEPLTLR